MPNYFTKSGSLKGSCCVLVIGIALNTPMRSIGQTTNSIENKSHTSINNSVAKTNKYEIKIQHITSEKDRTIIETNFLKKEGIVNCEVDINSRKITVKALSAIQVSDIIDIIRFAGYKPESLPKLVIE